MLNRRWLLATIAEDAPELARAHGLGLEIDAFCTAENMDPPAFSHWDALVRGQLQLAPGEVLHAPFSEIFPCAVDPKARKMALERLLQAADVARRYGIRRMVAHTGNMPKVYFPVWFEEQSALFWREFLAKQPEDFELLVENVLDTDPESITRMLSGVGDPRAKACLDVGHANVCSVVPLPFWVEILGPHLAHVHLHNNSGREDEHNPPSQGNINMKKLFEALDRHAPQATITLECPDAQAAVSWLTQTARSGT